MDTQNNDQSIATSVAIAATLTEATIGFYEAANIYSKANAEIDRYESGNKPYDAAYDVAFDVREETYQKYIVARTAYDAAVAALYADNVTAFVHMHEANAKLEEVRKEPLDNE